jgi:hypothetical protein
MNDKIFDIAESVMVQYAGSEEWVFTSDELKKFAELIVRECMRLCEAAEVELLSHMLREESFGAIDAKQHISDWFEIK